MKIGFDAKRAFLNKTGLGNYSRDTIRILSKYFKENNYVAFTTSKSNNSNSFLKGKENISVFTPKSIFNKLFNSFWRSKSIVLDLLENNVQIYHGLSNELPMGIEKTKIKTVVTIHDLIFIRYPNLYKYIDRKIYFAKFKSACQRADKIIAVSRQTKTDIIKYFNIPEKKISVVYQGCNQIFQNLVSNQKKNEMRTKYGLPERFLLYVGSIEKRKNVLTILKTIKDMKKQNLVIIGHGKSYKIKCKKFVEENNLSKRVFFLSNIQAREIAIIYQTAQIMIYPSIFEGFGIPILEALFSKVPVITTKGGCFEEAGGPYSKYIPPNSVKEMKKAIIEIQKSSVLKNEMISKGIKHAQNFTDDKIADNLIEVYSNL